MGGGGGGGGANFSFSRTTCVFRYQICLDGKKYFHFRKYVAYLMYTFLRNWPNNNCQSFGQVEIESVKTAFIKFTPGLQFSQFKSSLWKISLGGGRHILSDIFGSSINTNNQF